jgi:hypothetical protein
MLMPETSVHKDHFAAARENNIWPAGKNFPMQPESVPQSVNQPADGKLWGCIDTADTPHICTSLCRADFIHRWLGCVISHPAS